MYNYFPFCWDRFGSLPTAEYMAEILHQSTNLPSQLIPFELASDLSDNFAAAAWKKPHMYLHEDYRLNISSFRLASAAEVSNAVQRLAADLQNGRWKELYGEVLRVDKIDAGYYFLLARQGRLSFNGSG